MCADHTCFKRALRECKKHEETIRADKLANDLAHKDPIQFWRDVKQQSCKKAPLADSVDGTAGQRDIASMWGEHYHRLFNSVPVSPLKPQVLDAIVQDCESMTELPRVFTTDVLHRALQGLRCGKAVGPDGLSAEHLKFADRRVVVLLCVCFNASLVHGFLPKSFLYSVLVPVIKDRSGDPCSSSNYRPIAIISCLVKLFEKAILALFPAHFSTTDNQFGFKANHSTDMCIFTVKETIDFYLSSATPVYSCFLDASKAFDKVCHWTLFLKLLKKGLPAFLVRLIVFMYTSQCMSVRWGDHLSDPFIVSNGVRQGGVLSPVLFSIYMDDLSHLLTKSGIGCFMSSALINHVFYADDIVLMSPSAKGLQHLINLSVQYSDAHSLTFNALKSFCVSFIPHCLKINPNPSLVLKDTPLVFKQNCKYLGVFLSNDFTDDCDLTRQLRCFYVRVNYLCRTFNACSPNVKCTLFSSFCANIYAGHCWVNFKRCTMSKLTIAFNNCYRRFMSFPRSCSASAMFAFNHVCSFPEILRKCIFSFRNRLFNSHNVFIRSLLSSSFYSSRIWCHWHKLLFTFS